MFQAPGDSPVRNSLGAAGLRCENPDVSLRKCSVRGRRAAALMASCFLGRNSQRGGGRVVSHEGWREAGSPPFQT